jgi:hypothetical protein
MPRDHYVAIINSDGTLTRIGQPLTDREEAMVIVGFLNYEPERGPSAGAGIVAHARRLDVAPTLLTVERMEATIAFADELLEMESSGLGLMVGSQNEREALRELAAAHIASKAVTTIRSGEAETVWSSPAMPSAAK